MCLVFLGRLDLRSATEALRTGLSCRFRRWTAGSRPVQDPAGRGRGPKKYWKKGAKTMKNNQKLLFCKALALQNSSF